MSHFTLFGWLAARALRRGRTTRQSRPWLEALEDRQTPSTLTVTSATDDGSAGTLRAVIATASPGSTIVFDHHLDGKTITLTSGQLNLDKNLTIEGPGADRLTISGNAAGRVFDIGNAASVTIDGLTIADGAVVGRGGGAIQNDGSTLTVTGGKIADNVALGGNGGSGFADGLGAGGGLDDSTNPNFPNTSSASVGGVTFSGNAALGGDGGSGANGGNGVGGGIAVGSYSLLYAGYADASTLSLKNDSTLEQNNAQGGEGGTGGNGGDGLGGGLVAFAGASATVTDSTITENDADGGHKGAKGSNGQGVGGGVYDLGTFATDVLTVIKHNHASTSNDNLFTEKRFHDPPRTGY